MTNWIFTLFPFLKSPRFWGVVLTATVTLVKAKGWLDDDWMTWIQMIAGGATVVGTVGWAAKKLSPPVQ